MMAKLKLSNKQIEVAPVDQAVLLVKLDTIKQRLSATFGAVLMFWLLGLIEPRIMEIGLVPFIWFLLMMGPLVTGIYLLASPVWRALSLVERRNSAVGGIAIGLLAFDYVPLLFFIRGEGSGPVLVLTMMMGLILYSVYRWLGRPAEPNVNLDDLEMFP